MINYRSINDMNSVILGNLSRLPHDIDIVVGIPRSGLLPANLIALYINKPLTDIDSFVKGDVFGHGHRKISQANADIRKALIVDDSIFSGTSMNEAKEKLNHAVFKCEYCFLAIFAHPDSKDKVNFYCEEVPSPRVFQWNLFHHPGLMPYSFFDIDGVLCDNPPVDDDGPQYLNYILTAAPKFIPTYEIDTIVTCRLEKYRSATETWLKNNHVKYRKLVMLNIKSRAERIAWGKHGVFKGKAYRENAKAGLFVESSFKEAREIARLSRKPVFCTETFTMLDFGEEKKPINRLLHQIHITLWRLKMRILSKVII